VAGHAPSFETWSSQESYMLHEYMLALWGMPLSEMFDLEKSAKTCIGEREVEFLCGECAESL
jgi:hypothetical protein